MVTILSGINWPNRKEHGQTTYSTPKQAEQNGARTVKNSRMSVTVASKPDSPEASSRNTTSKQAGGPALSPKKEFNLKILPDGMNQSEKVVVDFQQASPQAR